MKSVYPAAYPPVLLKSSDQERCIQICEMRQLMSISAMPIATGRGNLTFQLQQRYLTLCREPLLTLLAYQHLPNPFLRRGIYRRNAVSTNVNLRQHERIGKQSMPLTLFSRTPAKEPNCRGHEGNPASL